MDKIKRFFECLLPVTACNLKCSYCYVIQRDNRKMKMPSLKYSPEVIGQGLSKERLGGVCYFSICGAGETLLPKETLEITKEILRNGHYVNLTTNGTISERFKELADLPSEYRDRLHIAFSLHYLELLRIKKLDAFFANITLIHNAGISYLVQINLCDEYLPYWNEIKTLCEERIGAAPQVAATRKENQLESDIELLTSLTASEYKEIGDRYESPLFDFTMKNFNVHQKNFCYAGDWSGVLNLETGILSRCYGSRVQQDIFKDINKPIDFCAIGCHCKSRFCMNSSHFMSLGVIPELNTPTYANLRNRQEAGWYSSNMLEFLNQKLGENNIAYTKQMKLRSEYYNLIEQSLFVWQKLKGIIKRIIKKSR